jgi:hypothetical protein
VEHQEASTQASTAMTEHPFGKPPENLPRASAVPNSRVTDRAGIRIETIDLAKKSDRAKFLDMVYDVYRDDPNFITPLRMERMKFLDTAHNAALKSSTSSPCLPYRGDRIVGRITAHIDRAYNEYQGVKAGWFGFFECIDDRQVAHALLDEAVKWVTQQGATEVIGPFNFTTNHQVGLLAENFSRPAMIEMTYNPSYYEALITSYGFGKAKDLYAWWIDVSKGLEDPKIARFHRISEKVKKRLGVTIRGADMSKFEEEVALIFDLYNGSWEKNWGFVPVSREEFATIAKDLKQIIVPSLVLIVEDKGKPVGFSVTLPNVNEVMPRNGKLFPFGWYKLLTGMKKVTSARLFTLGILPSHRKRGLESLLCIETALRSKELGIPGGEIGWTLEDNDLINRACESMGARLDRRYRLYGLTLGSR